MTFERTPDRLIQQPFPECTGGAGFKPRIRDYRPAPSFS